MADIDEESEASITEVCFILFYFFNLNSFSRKNFNVAYIFFSDAKNYSKSRRNEKPKAFVI